jgi:hypothetical protein
MPQLIVFLFSILTVFTLPSILVAAYHAQP